MRARVLVVALGVLAAVGAVAGDAAAFSAVYDQKTTQGREVYQGKVAMKDELFRMEVTYEGQAMIIINNASGTYTVMPSEGMAMKTSQLRPGQRTVRGASNYAQYLQQNNAERTGSETVDGHACDIYHFTDGETGEVITAWVWKEKMFPVKYQTESKRGTTLIELSNIQLGANVSADAFELPAGVQVMDMGGFMGM